MHDRLSKQLDAAGGLTPDLDVGALLKLIDTTYRDFDRSHARSQRRIAELALEVEKVQQRLRSAFEVVPEGLALFDAEDRYVMWNRRYAEFHPELAGHLAVGMKFETALRICLSEGFYAAGIGREEEWLRDRLARHAMAENIEEQERSNGQWLRVEEIRTSDGGSIGVRVDITELKRKEASFRLLFESNPIPMWVFDAETLRFLSVNAAAVAHYGFTADQFMSMTILDIRPEAIRADMEEHVRNTITKHRQDGRVWRHKKADGTLIDMSIYDQLLLEKGKVAVLVAAIDVTEQNRAADEIRQTREFLDTIINSVPASIFVKEPRERRYVLVNRAGELLFGRPRDQIIGSNDRELFPQDAMAISEAHEEELLHGDRSEIFSQETLTTPFGGTRLLSVNRTAILDDAGRTQYLLGVADDVTEKNRAEQRIAYLATHDALTGLPNRPAFMEQLEDRLGRATDAGERFSVFSIDLDRFKSINDVFGHPVGDLLLKEFSERLTAAAGDATVARLGGDEFMLICHGSQQPADSEDLSSRIRVAMDREFLLDGHVLRVGLSIGIAVFPEDGDSCATLLANADAALYRSKADGRGAIRFFDKDMDKRLRDRRSLQNDLSGALDRGELSVFFQPQSRTDGEITGFEALARWIHPTRGSVSPGIFIPLAEESNLINDISRWVLKQACRTAVRWEKPLTVAVNLSPVQFQHGDLPELVASVLLETGLAPGRLELEITEGVLISDFARTVSLLNRIKALGVKIAMDDFGTGYSSLSYLQSFPFDKIKIDQSFVAKLQDGSQSMAILRAVIGLCRGLNVPVIAEGVETEWQRAFLSAENCDEIQGFLIGRPLPIEDYAELVGPGTSTEHYRSLRQA